MKIAYFSPMPPAPTGVADYSAHVVEALTPLARINVNDDGPADIAVYHIGNNALHREIYQRALTRPGVVVIHDAMLQHFFLGWLDEAQYIDEFVYNYGAWSSGLASELYRQRARSGADARYFAYPMLKRIAETWLGVIVHNPAAAAIVRTHAPGAQITEIPHLYTAPAHVPDAVATLRFRHQLGFGPGTVVLGALGFQRETKRLAPLLRAFHRAHEAAPNLRLIFSTEFVSKAFARSLEPLLQHPSILRVPYLSEHDFWRYAAAIDVCANLRYPSAAETSGIAIRMMGLGKTVLLTGDESIARLPDDACLRVDTGPSEEDMLAGYLVWLAQHREVAAQIGTRAAAYIAREHAPARVAALYLEAIRTAWETSSRSPSKSGSADLPTGPSAPGAVSAPAESR